MMDEENRGEGRLVKKALELRVLLNVPLNTAARHHL
jgi:hypothetical protein